MTYPKELLDRFDKAAGKVSVASSEMIAALGKPEEGEAKNALKQARAEYDEINSKLDELDA